MGYSYEFNIHVIGTYNRNPYNSTVQTNSDGEGHINIEGANIPINLVGKGKSKAMKKARAIATWYMDCIANREANQRFKNMVPYKKRASSRARKKLKNVSRRHHDYPSYAPPGSMYPPSR